MVLVDGNSSVVGDAEAPAMMAGKSGCGGHGHYNYKDTASSELSLTFRKTLIWKSGWYQPVAH